jgi:hypothetical protein
MDSNYIIDFERVNELTSSIHDKQNDGSFAGSTFVYSVSRSVIKEFLDLYIRSTSSNSEKQKTIINTLVYNKILISKADIRDSKIEQILH